MTWFKVDDSFWSHPKVLELSDAAIAMWVKAGSYSAQYLTNGTLTLLTLHSICAQNRNYKRAVNELVKSGLWEFVSDTEIHFHDWESFQPSRAEILERREETAARVREWRAKKRDNKAVSNTDSNAVTQHVTHHVTNNVRNHVSNASPDPTRPIYKETTSKEVVKKNTKTLIPDSWTPTVAHRDLAARKNIDIESEAAKFVDWAKANGRKYVDWDRAFSNWLRNAENFNRKPGYVNHAQEKLNAHLNMIAAAEARERQPQLIEGSNNAFGF